MFLSVLFSLVDSLESLRLYMYTYWPRLLRRIVNPVENTCSTVQLVTFVDCVCTGRRSAPPRRDGFDRRGKCLSCDYTDLCSLGCDFVIFCASRLYLGCSGRLLRSHSPGSLP